MRWSELYIPTLREAPTGMDSAGQALLARAGYLRGTGPDRAWLPLGVRAAERVELMLIRALGPTRVVEVWAEGLGQGQAPTFAREMRSHKQFPQTWYRRTGTRIEALSMMLSQSAGLEQAVEAVLSEAGLGAIGRAEGLGSSEFIAPDARGATRILQCACGYRAVADAAQSRAVPPAEDEANLRNPEPFVTPGAKTIAEVAAITGEPESRQMKSLVMAVAGSPVLVLVRGDHTLSEAKLRSALGVNECRPATAREIIEWFGAEPGSLGPVGIRQMPVLADRALEGRRNMIAGANRDGYHLRYVTPGVHFQPMFADLRAAAAGETCIQCGEPLQQEQGTALARVTKPIEAADWPVSDASGKNVSPRVAGLELFTDRIVIAAAEQHRDNDGLAWPQSFSPFDLLITPVNWNDAPQREAAVSLYERATSEGMRALIDDRDERPGVKFKDGDLTGIPLRITVGKKIGEGVIEFVLRATKTTAEVRIEDVFGAVKRARA